MHPEEPAPQTLLRRLGAPLAAFAATLLFQLPFFDRWFNFMDEGHMLLFSEMVARGGEFYRDATFYPLPGAFLFLAAVFEVLEPSILLTRWIVVLQFSLFVALIYVLLRRLVSAPWAWLAVLCLWLYRIWGFPHWHIYSYSTTALLVQLVCMLLLLRFFESGDRRVLALSGFVFGLGVLCKQDYGAAFMIAFVIGLAVWARSGPRVGRRPLAPLLVWFFLPAGLVGAATGLHYWRVGVLDDLLRFTVWNHFVGMSSYSYDAFPDLLPLFGQDPELRTKDGIKSFMPGIMFTVDWPALRSHPLFTHTGLYDVLVKLFLFGPFLLLAGGALRLWRRRYAFGEAGSDADRQRFLREGLLWLVAGMLLLLVWLNKPQDYLHLAVLYWPLIGLCLVYTRSLLSGRRRLALATVLLLVVPVSALLGSSARAAWLLRSIHSERIEGPRAGIWVKPFEARMLNEVVAYVQEKSAPGETVAVLPYFPIVSFLADRPGPHRTSYILWPFPEIPERDQRVIEAMEATRTRLVIYHFTQFSFPPVWEYASELFDYLVDDFEIDRVFSYDLWGYKLVGLEREDPPEGRPLVSARGDEVSISVVTDGPPRPVLPEERATWLMRAAWPFRRVLALRPTVSPGYSVMSVPLSVPDGGARLRTAVGVHPHWWFRMPPTRVGFRLVVVDGDERRELFATSILPARELADRRWIEVDVSLDEWAGRDVRIDFIDDTERTRGETVWMGGWAEPRLVTPPAGTGEVDPAPGV